MKSAASIKISVDNYKKRFKRAKGIIKVIPEQGKRIDPYLFAYSASVHLLVRAKYLFLATLDQDEKKNAYASYVLVRAFFETCMALGYLAVKLDKKNKEKDLEGIWRISDRILQGGKHFPDDVYLKDVKKERTPAINIYDYLDEVDKDLRRVENLKDSAYAPHREMYDSVLSEFGHPNYLGLRICSLVKRDFQGNLHREEIFLSKSIGRGDRANYLNYLDWGSVIFFHYWGKLESIFKEVNLNLPKI